MLYKKYKRKRHFTFALLLMVFFAIVGLNHIERYSQKVNSHNVNEIHKVKKHGVTKKDTIMRTPINWKLSSETVPYPDLEKYNHLWIDVSINAQRVFIMDNNTRLYEMYCSTGTKEEPTPLGKYEIQSQKGNTFYNPKTSMGANYWVSFKDNGVYLFHSVPINKDGNYIENEAEKLGTKTGSHGCIRLSVQDAKWFYNNIPTGTPVYIQTSVNVPSYAIMFNTKLNQD